MKFKSLCVAVMFALTSVAVVAQESPASRAFAHYEAIRTALSSDSIAGVKDHALSLRADAVSLAGADVATHVDALAKAEKIEDARKHFGELSALLVPKLLEAKLPGMHGFMCPMLKKTWVQKGADVQNPYYGKSMLSCGTAIKDR
jgi:hypothetical protein